MDIGNTILNLINDKSIEPEIEPEIEEKKSLILNKPNMFIIGVHDLNSLKHYNISGEQNKDVPDVSISYYFIINEDPHFDISDSINIKQISPGHKIEFDLSKLESDAKSVTVIVQTDKIEDKLFFYFDGVEDTKLHKQIENMTANNAYYLAKITKDDNGIWSIVEIINYGE
jgi:hypothetical protein